MRGNHLALLLALALPITAAQEDQEEWSLVGQQWFHVEVILFERLAEQAEKFGNEQLVSNAPLSYPLDIIALAPYADEALGPANPGQAEALKNSILGDIWDDQEVGPWRNSASLRRFQEWLRNETAFTDFHALFSALADPDSLGQYWPYIPRLDNLSGLSVEREVREVEEDSRSREYEIPARLAFRSLTEEKLRLRGEAILLSNSKNYRVLSHRAWRQPVPERGAQIPVLVRTETDDADGAILEGYLGLERGRFVHLSAHLWMHENSGGGKNLRRSQPEVGPDSQLQEAGDEDVLLALPGAPEGGEGPLHYIEMQAQMRVHADTLHHIDHPKFGLLIQIQSYEPQYGDPDLLEPL